MNQSNCCYHQKSCDNWTCSKRDFTLVVSFGSNNVKPLHFPLVFCVLSALISVFISAWYILYRTQVNRICFVQILTQACPLYFETTKQTQAHTHKKNPSQTFITASMDTVDWVTGKKLDHWFVPYRGEAQKRFKNSTEVCLVLLMEILVVYLMFFFSAPPPPKNKTTKTPKYIFK